ncbi:bifunctional [glutamate--ammonia ligase]-adenylyl-L-tyrosine phosphorylase/[glutamate--ammonia-ligase] adenylyltransferase [Facilibium subflavum]|uniref:bifunctional [glutamate--ammonia ligase]-adenylyl-L-tyrosine phosphorylase/[glutamate--ammonia-ligase] adenylyltransferase n=1 Tax=Facilibium subflavum TaxID=2219058 RepID=UPI000E65683D|nr:bifunctional [glutamate--ammonia ligase]-adenylyl-L-tyrosine phosphorylase/[glutamate--ammonia-ligase] adenylyltransferase [Facilibium subflavum]
MPFSKPCDTLLKSLPHKLIAQLKDTFQASLFFRQVLTQMPEIIYSTHWQQKDDQTYLTQTIDGLFTKTDDFSQMQQALRRLKKKHYAKLVFQQQHGFADFEHIAFVLSFIAKYTLTKSYHYLFTHLIKQYKLLQTPLHMAIIAMGKLGGNELNFSSDIDLVFVYPKDETLKRNSDKTISGMRFYTLIGQQLITLMSEVTADGFMYRVDMRLRPFGETSPLVSSRSHFVDYLIKHARDWERYAYIKSDILTGSPDFSYKLQKQINDFVYRHYLDYKMLSSIRDMKQMIMQEMKQTTLKDNIKLGRGGIREIEFICQCFQLIYGGQDKRLQTNSLKNALSILAKAGHISYEDQQQLYSHYVLLRDVENALQMYDDQQTHLLPTQEHQRKAVIKLSRISSEQDFDKKISTTRKAVQILFDRLTNFQNPNETDAYPKKAQSTNLIVEKDDIPYVIDNQLIEHFFQKHTFSANEKIMIYQLIAHAQKIQDIALVSEVLNLIHTLYRRKTYLYLLCEKQSELEGFVRVLSYGKRLPSMISKYPFLLERALTAKHHDQIYLSLNKLRDALQAQLQKIDLTDTESFLETLRRFKVTQTFNIIVAEIRHKISLMESSDLFSYLATVLVEAALEGAWREVFLQTDIPKDLQKHYKDSLGIIAYGKLGGLELSLSSDLDLVFLSHIQCDNIKSNLFVRVIQKFIHYMQIQTYTGKLYDIDLRLRPNGENGLLVSPISAYRQYLEDKAWTWEHQALTRARFISGAAQIKPIFNTIRQRILTQKRDIGALKKDITQMREKMRRHHLKTQNKFDLKQSPGGMVDIEFIAQFYALAYSYQRPEISYYSDSIRIIQSMESAQFINMETAETLIQAYCFFRDLSFKCYLNKMPSIVSLDQVAHFAKPVIQIWQTLF